MLHPIVPFDFLVEPPLWLDFTSQNEDLRNVDLKNTTIFEAYVFGKLAVNNKTVGVGGYLEHRNIYQRSEHFDGLEEPRIVHLGVDIWAAAFTPVFAPVDSVIHSFKDNANFGDYGPTIILEHLNYENQHIPRYSLYGHLSRESLGNLNTGQKIKAGTQFAEFGPYPENGDWPPHLHFQLLTDLLGNSGDFPGVCSVADKDFYAKICLNPYGFLGIKEHR